MFSEEWFKPILMELTQSDKVLFLFSLNKIYSSEIQRSKKALEFYKIIGKKRLVEADQETVDDHIGRLLSHEDFSSCSDCDDAHIFAMIWTKPTRYVFSMDARMAKCRDKINRSIESRYCDFIVISKRPTYDFHRLSIIT
jgi:hypothetical protein